jgi:hypothetical protein
VFKYLLFSSGAYMVSSFRQKKNAWYKLRGVRIINAVVQP